MEIKVDIKRKLSKNTNKNKICLINTYYPFDLYEDRLKWHKLIPIPHFVIKKTGSTLLSNRAINYVFSSNNDVGKYWPSPYTKKSIDYVLSTTKNNKNTWVTVKANVQKDFKKLHEIDVTEISGIAIMTDTDNSKLKAISYYQDIYFSAE